MNKSELQSRGWHTWYNEDYWVNPKCVIDPLQQDYTNYGCTFDQAVSKEINGIVPVARALPIELFS